MLLSGFAQMLLLRTEDLIRSSCSRKRKDVSGMSFLPSRRAPSDQRAAGVDNADDEAFRLVYREYAPPLLGYLMRWTSGNRQLSEDVLQETLLRAWRNMDQLDHTAGSLRPWLFTVARRVLVDHHRRTNARPQEVDGTCIDESAVTVEDQIEPMLASVVVSDALASISEAHRNVLRELYFRGRSTDEAAKALGIPRGTVLSRSYYALRTLRSALEERGITSRYI
jgi:RNA polymerase sigma-70 factor (ECF subfamily)